MIIDKDLVIVGAGRDITMIDGASIDRVLRIAPGVNVVLSGVTIQNGSVSYRSYAPSAGGGIYSEGHLVLKDCVVRNNRADEGGAGIMAVNGTLALSNVVVVGNESFAAPGIQLLATVAIFDGCLVIGNQGSVGGGITAHGGSLTILNSTISGNRNHGFSGGGIARSW